MSRPARLPRHFPLSCIAACALALSALPSRAAPDARIHELAQQEKAPLLNTLRDLVNIESGSKDAEGLARLGALMAELRTRRGGKAEIISRPTSTGWKTRRRSRARWCTPNSRAPATG